MKIRGGTMMVEACLRNGEGGSPTVVLHGIAPGERELAALAVRSGVSHVVVLDDDRAGGSRRMRFFTVDGELPSCGHGTVAAIAALAARRPEARFAGVLHSGGRDFDAGGDVGAGGVVEAWFDQGVVRRRPVAAAEQEAFLAALGLEEGDLKPDDNVVVMSPGRERLLIPVRDREILAGLRPDQRRLAAVSREFDQLGCFVYAPPTPGGRAEARMFAPAIGVPEDVANANSSGCLAAHLLAAGRNPVLAVDQGDALGRPSTVCASATWLGPGIGVRVGGTARLVPEPAGPDPDRGPLR